MFRAAIFLVILQILILNYFFLVELHIIIYFTTILLTILSVSFNYIQIKNSFQWVTFSWISYFWAFCLYSSYVKYHLTIYYLSTLIIQLEYSVLLLTSVIKI